MLIKDCVDCAGFWNCPKAKALYLESQEIAKGNSRHAVFERRAFMLRSVRGCEEFRKIRQLVYILQPAMAEV